MLLICLRPNMGFFFLITVLITEKALDQEEKCMAVTYISLLSNKCVDKADTQVESGVSGTSYKNYLHLMISNPPFPLKSKKTYAVQKPNEKLHVTIFQRMF